MSLEGHEGASFVLAHQPTIAGHVGSKYCSESSFHRTPPRFRRGRSSRPLIVLSFVPAGYRFAGSVTASSLFRCRARLMLLPENLTSIAHRQPAKRSAASQEARRDGCGQGGRRPSLRERVIGQAPPHMSVAEHRQRTAPGSVRRLGEREADIAASNCE